MPRLKSEPALHLELYKLQLAKTRLQNRRQELEMQVQQIQQRLNEIDQEIQGLQVCTEAHSQAHSQAHSHRFQSLDAKIQAASSGTEPPLADLDIADPSDPENFQTFVVDY
jgi:septal ring factor EnvC (AmiA/AmiB activator)